EVTDEQAGAVSPYTAEVAAGLLDADERRALHRRLADLVPPRESARHLAAAGEPKLAYDRAVEAAAQATSLGERAELLALACELPGAQPAAAVRLRTAATALAVGWPQTAVRALGQEGTPDAAVLRGEALLQLGDPAAALEAVTAVPDDVADPTRAGRDRLRLLGLLARDPAAALATAADVERLGSPAHAGLRAALAATRAARPSLSGARPRVRQRGGQPRRSRRRPARLRPGPAATAAPRPGQRAGTHRLGRPRSRLARRATRTGHRRHRYRHRAAARR